jgi:NADP-dependent 3-hydroxy acid dehydrogenase YdfG
MHFRYRKILIIGATSGIGESVAGRFIKEGCGVIAVGSRQEHLDAFIKKYGSSRVWGVRIDLNNTENIPGFVSKYEVIFRSNHMCSSVY